MGLGGGKEICTWHAKRRRMKMKYETIKNKRKRERKYNEQTGF
jgi:hypothetical protein